MTAVYADPICTSKQSPPFGVESVNTGTLSQEPYCPLIMTINSRPTALKGLTTPKLVVPAGKSSSVSVTAYVPAAPLLPLYVNRQDL